MHFNVDEPSGDRIQHYTERRKAPHSSVWLDDRVIRIAEIVQEYSA